MTNFPTFTPPPAVPRLGLRCWLAAAVWCCLGAAVHAAPATREYDVKAAFLYNFASFIDWPAEAFASPESPLVIAVVGEDPFGSVLDELVAGERVNGRAFVVRRFASADRPGYEQAHILFVSSSEAKAWHTIAQRVGVRPVLTVADVAGFTEDGGAIGFTTVGRVRFSINTTVLESAGLTASSKLLRLARVTEQRKLAP